MQSHLIMGTNGLGLGTGALHSRPHALRKHQVPHRRSSAARRGQLHLTNSSIKQDINDAFGRLGKRQAGEDTNADEGAGLGLDLGSMFRNVFDFSTGKAPSNTAAAATAAAAAAAYTPPAAAAVASPPVPPGPYAAAQMLAASSAIPSSSSPSSGPQPLAALAEQVLAGGGALQEDPVAAARQLQLFLSQYRDQYGPETDARISAAVSKLQDYIEGYSQQAPGVDAAGAAGAAVGVLGRSAAAGGTGGEGEVYHNYILEQLTGVLDWVNNLLVNNNPKPYVFDAYGRVLADPNAAGSVEQQQEQLRAASNSLRTLIQQLQQVNRQYAAMAEPDEKAAMGQVLSQLTTMADRLAVAATRRPLPPPVPGGGAAADAAASAAGDLSPYIRPEEVYGVEKYRDPLLRVLDGIYHAVVVDSGLREFLSGVKQLGDSLVSSMAVAWTGAPPIGRLVAYIAAVAGVVFVMRTRLPSALLAPTNFLAKLGSGGGGGGGGGLSLSKDGGDAADPAAAPGAPANPAAAAAFAAIAGNDGGGSGTAAAFGANPLAALDRDAGVGDTRLPSELLASNDPYAARKALVDTQATPVPSAAGATAAPPRRGGGGSFGNGWGTLTGGTAGGAQAAGSAPGSPGLFTSASFPSSIPKPPPGGWTSQYSDRADWWSLGQQQQQPPQSQPPPPPAAAAAASPFPPASPLDPGSSSNSSGGGGGGRRTVAESWEAFRIANDPGAAAAAAAVGGGGVLDTTAALAAAAVAAAVGPVAAGIGVGVGAGGDPKLAELARATEERRLSKDKARLRATIKDRLRWVCLALGPVSSVVPGGEPLRDEVDGLLAQLEALSPTDKPLNTMVDAARRPTVGVPTPLVDPLLLGDWRLVYASNASSTAGVPSAASQAAGGGPNLLAQLLHVADSLPGFGMTHVVQRLSLEPAAAGGGAAAAGGAAGGGQRFTSTASSTSSSSSSSLGLGGGGGGGGGGGATVVTENSATFRFGPLGSWRVSVRGRWIDNGGGMCAAAEFESFAVRPVDLWGLALDQLLPEVVVPVPDVLRSRSEWCTTYLDEEMRIGRGSGGALFLFKRGAEDAEQVVMPGRGAGAGAVAGVARGQPAPAGVAASVAALGGAAGIQNPAMRPL